MMQRALIVLLVTSCCCLLGGEGSKALSVVPLVWSADGFPSSSSSSPSNTVTQLLTNPSLHWRLEVDGELLNVAIQREASNTVVTEVVHPGALHSALKISFTEPRKVGGVRRPGECVLSLDDADEESAVYFSFDSQTDRAATTKSGSVLQGDEQEVIGTATLRAIHERRLELSLDWETDHQGTRRPSRVVWVGSRLHGEAELQPSTVWRRWGAPVVAVLALYGLAKITMKIMTLRQPAKVKTN